MVHGQMSGLKYCNKITKSFHKDVSKFPYINKFQLNVIMASL